MNRKCLAMAIVVLFTVSLAGCATESGYYDPARSAGAGARAGPPPAPRSAPSSVQPRQCRHRRLDGAAAGGVLGGVGGALYAEHRNSEIHRPRIRPRRITPRAGNMVSADNVMALPSTVSPGQQVMLSANYTILTPVRWAGVRHPGAGDPVSGQLGGLALRDPR